MSNCRFSSLAFIAVCLLFCACQEKKEDLPKEIFENVALVSQEEVTAFAEFGYETIHGDLLILDAVQNLSALSTLKEVTGHLMFSQTKELESLNGLDNLEKIGGHLNFSWNEVLHDISALSSVDSLHKDLILMGNRALSNFDGFENIEYIGGDINFEWNEFEQLTGFESLEKTSGGITIENNHKMQHITGFGRLDKIRGSVRVSWNDALAEITGLAKLADLDFGSLIISHNKKLNNFCGFKSVSTNPFIISIDNNLYNPTLDEIRQGDCRQ